MREIDAECMSWGVRVFISDFFLKKIYIHIYMQIYIVSNEHALYAYYIFYYSYCIYIYHIHILLYLNYPSPPPPDGMRRCRSDWPVLLLATLVCCQPTELILGFFCFINFPIIVDFELFFFVS